MPTRLKVAIGLLIVSAGMNLIAGKWLAAIVGVALLLGVLKGSEGTRVIIVGLSVLGLIFSAVTKLAGMAFSPLVFGVGLLGAAQNAFTIWCMQDAESQDWMYKRSLPD